MQSVSDTYVSLYANPDHCKEVKMTVAGVEYGENSIWSLKTSGSLYASDIPSVGGCVAREIDCTFTPAGTIPRMAEIRVYVRLVLRDLKTDEVLQASEWIPKGVFNIDTRSRDPRGRLTVHGYDVMLHAEQVFLGEVETGDWPRSEVEVVQEIADRLGVSIDSRTVLNENYMVTYPNDYTMREILGYVAAAHAGNWTITDVGELRLVGLVEIPTETNYLVTEKGNAITFGGVRILV